MKKIILIILSILIILFLFLLLIPNKVAVLGYHSFTDKESTNDMIVSEKDFIKQMEFIKNNNMKTLTLDDMDCYMNKKCKIKRNSILITMDDGYLDNYRVAFPILKKYGLNAVVFLIGINTEKDAEGFFNKEFIEKTKKEYPNIEFASHGYNLHDIDTSNFSYDDYMKDFKLQEKILKTKYFAYPFGKSNKKMIKVLKDNNYKLAFDFGPKFKKASNKDNKYEIPRLSINGSMPLWKFKLRLLLPF